MNNHFDFTSCLLPSISFTGEITMNTHTKPNPRPGVTLLIVLAMMVMFAMLVTTFMVIVSQHRQNAELYADILTGAPPKGLDGGTRKMTGSGIRRGDTLDIAFQRLLTGSANLDNVIAPHSIVENLLGSPGGVPFGGTLAPLFEQQDEESGKPFALRPNVLAPNADGKQEYKKYLQEHADVPIMNPDYTAPDHATMFLAWNDVKTKGTEGIALRWVIPSFHRPQLVDGIDSADPNYPHEIRKYVLRPLPTDHPDFTGSNPAAKGADMETLKKFLCKGPWDVDNDGDGKADGIWLDIGLPARYDAQTQSYYKPLVSYYVVDLDGRINVNTFGNPGQSAPPDKPSGMGLGTAELYSALLKKDVLEERYGNDTKPGGSGNNLPENNGINYNAYTNGGLVADWLGTSPIDFDDLGNRKAGTPTSKEDIPYLMNPYAGADNTDDTPFEMGKHLEPFLRSILDVDYASQERLRELLDPYDPAAPALTKQELRYSLTTRSSNIPLAAPLYDRVLKLCGDDKDKADALWTQLLPVLPKEIKEGKKVDLNRLTLSENWMTGGTALLKEKVKFAQEIFYILRIVFYKEIKNGETLERLAQWSVNLVDFIDPDDVMTPFIFKKGALTADVFDNTPLIDNLLAGTLSLGNDYVLIWGNEKSEVVLTETLAVHNRNTESNGIGGFCQKIRPQGSLFVELYRQGNPHRNYSASASSLVDSAGKLDLSKRTGTNGDYIWRLAVGETTKTAANQFTWDKGNTTKNALHQLLKSEGTNYPQFYQWYYQNPAHKGAGEFHPDLGVPERFIWFGQDEPLSGLAAERENKQRSFYDKDGRADVSTGEKFVVLPPDTPLVVTPWESPRVNAGVSFDLTGKRIMIAESPVTVDTVVNVSEPLDGYPPITVGTNTAPFDTDGVLRQRGTVPCYKTICLQRLADPNRNHDPICNPYLTVDWSMIDLQAINTKDPNNEEGVTTDASGMYFSSRQWKKSTDPYNLWDRTLTQTELGKNKAGLEKTDTLTHSLGTPPLKPFIHFPWNDAPLMNTGELMLVPSSAPGRFGVEFHDNGTSEKFFGEPPRYTPRFSYSYDTLTASPYLHWGNSVSDEFDMSLLLDFVHVPSRFTGASAEREPGKINLNTVTEEGWKALQNNRTNCPDYSQFHVEREKAQKPDGEPLRSPMAALLGLDNMMNNSADNPYTALENVMRLSDVTTTRSNVFAVWITVGYFSVEKAENLDALKAKYPGHDFEHISNGKVFEAVYPDQYVLGTEKGLDDGSVKRHRAFYLIDRSNLMDSDTDTSINFQRGTKLDAKTMKKVIFTETVLE